MIKVFSEKSKNKYEIIAVASLQKDLNNLRLMSYEVHDGKDKVQLNKDKYGGPYLKFKCDEFKQADESYDIEAIAERVILWQKRYD